MPLVESKPRKRSLNIELRTSDSTFSTLSPDEDSIPVKKRLRRAQQFTQKCIPPPPPLINMTDYINSKKLEEEKFMKEKQKHHSLTTFSIPPEAYNDNLAPPYLGPYVFPENASSLYLWPRQVLPYPGFKIENLKSKLRIEDICKSPNDSRTITASKKSNCTLHYTLAALTGLPLAIKGLS
ncbi:DgyrCDS10678 [Dimorphilus gyrociliatus]|uniref:DgyrCDS10678 n=1 Tax=Dimorphilus gyrociliatus TaxID=2664684 RepID=A0A7I8W208_9ANNE|nr:DgyrCDS10678 [Dimorphilus gyrociliatus]